MSTVERDNAGTAVQLPPGMGVPPVPTDTEIRATSPGGVSDVKVEESKSADRDYVVLKREKQESPNAPLTWTFVENIGATSAEQAVRRAAETPGTSFLNPDGPTTLVAIPARSFNPITVAVQTTTSIILS